MNQLTKNKIILYLAALFLVGGVTGGVLGWTGAQQRSRRPPSPEGMCNHFRHELKSELDLTPTQLQQLEPLLEKRVKNMETVHARTIQQFEEVIRASNEEIATTLGLNPTQRAKLEEMERKRQDFMRKRFRPPEDAAKPPANGP